MYFLVDAIGEEEDSRVDHGEDEDWEVIGDMEEIIVSMESSCDASAIYNSWLDEI